MSEPSTGLDRPAPSGTGNEPQPPRAQAHPRVLQSPFGERIDPYYWLRDDRREDPRVLQHLRAENAYREAAMAGTAALERRLYEEIVARLPQDDRSVPYLKNGYWYYARYLAGLEHPVFARRADHALAPEEVLLDANELAREHEYYRIGSLEVSPDSRRLAYCEDVVGRREYRLRFKDLDAGRLEPEIIEDVEPDIAWANDGCTVLYVAKDPETLLGVYVRRHRIGTDPREDALVFEQTDRSFYTGVTKSKSERFIFIYMESTVASEWRFADADDPSLEFRTFLAHEPDHEYQIEHLGPWFVIRTNWSAPNFRLMYAPIDALGDRARWRELLSHRDDGFIHDFDVFNGFVAVSLRSGGLRRILLQPLPDGAGPAPWPQSAAQLWIDGDEPAFTLDLGDNAQMDAKVLRYTYSSPTTPTVTYDYDLRTGTREERKREAVIGDFEPSRYRCEFIHVQAADGASIPVSIVYHRDTPRDGTAPLLVYAYGAYGLCVDPAFSVSRLSLLDRGFVHATAHVRGGQELGRAWYDAGRLRHKANSFSDFIDATRALVAGGYGGADRVFAMGGSAGGLLVAAVANLAPELYRGIVAQVPFVDVVTTMLDQSIPLTTNEYDEWGDPSRAEDYAYMLSYSPYDNVTRQAYPAMLVTTGLWDSQVQYYEPVKWVAKLREHTTGGEPILLHVEMEAGHGGKAGRFERYGEVAMEFAFLLGRLARIA